MRALLCSLLWGGAFVALASTSEAANSRAKHRRPSGYYYNSPTTTTERQLRNQRAYERGEYYEHDFERSAIRQPGLVGTENARGCRRTLRSIRSREGKLKGSGKAISFA